MKISNSINLIYNERHAKYASLKKEVDNTFNVIKHHKWHYESRLKELVTFALKAETGRFLKISELEDFLGCCLVVENSTTLSIAEKLICEHFNVIERRPKIKNFTHKDPSSFIFDDIRLYAKLKKEDYLPDREFDDCIFEIQLKTFLQHAWAIATHDLVYKGDCYNWANNRIAFQVKASLEHAELSIFSAQEMAKRIDISDNPEYKKINKILKVLGKHWSHDSLPQDTVRLAKNVFNILQMANINLNELSQVCQSSELIGSQPLLSLSPYQAICISCMIYHTEKMQNIADKKIFLSTEALEHIPTNIYEIFKEKILTPQ